MDKYMNKCVLCVLLTADLMWSKHMYIEAVETLDTGCLQTTLANSDSYILKSAG